MSIRAIVSNLLEINWGRDERRLCMYVYIYMCARKETNISQNREER